MRDFSLEQLRAYVDGELPAPDADAIRQASESDPALAADIAALRASQLPYREALRAAGAPVLPEALRESVGASVRSAVSQAEPTTVVPMPRSTRYLPRIAGIAATFVLGLVLGPVLLAQLSSSTGADKISKDDAAWAALVADYQSLYVPETVASIDRGTARAAAEALLQSVASQPGLDVAIPDLTSLDYDFVRAQQLGYNGEPLIQLVYTNPDGHPLAVCFMPADNTGALSNSAVVGITRGLGTIHWRDQGTRFVVVADESASRLTALSDLILSQGS